MRRSKFFNSRLSGVMKPHIFLNRNKKWDWFIAYSAPTNIRLRYAAEKFCENKNNAR